MVDTVTRDIEILYCHPAVVSCASWEGIFSLDLVDLAELTLELTVVFNAGPLEWESSILSSSQEASPVVGKNKKVILVPCCT